jgi:hypothetical protein
VHWDRVKLRFAINGIVGDMSRSIESRVEPENSRVRYYAVVLASKFPGDYTINQIDFIYNYLKEGDDSISGWHYVRDARGMDYLSYANESLVIGSDAGSTGAGDCDDFAILISSVIEAMEGRRELFWQKTIVWAVMLMQRYIWASSMLKTIRLKKS